MKRELIFFVLVALQFGCHQRTPKMTDEQMRKMRAEAPYVTEACLEKIRWSGIEAVTDDDECFKKLPPKRWRGLWRDDFEGSLFCPAPAQQCTNQGAPSGIWLEFEPRPATIRNRGPGGLYAVEFIGRQSDRGTPMAAYGYEQDIVVDRMISMREIKE